MLSVTRCCRRHRLKFVESFFAVCLLAFGLTALPSPLASQSPARKPAAQRRPLTQADVQKLWAGKDDKLFANEIRLRGLSFAPTAEWIDVELPRLTGVDRASVPLAAAALSKLVPPPPDLDLVAQQAPDLLAKLKAAAQKHDDSAIQPLVDSTLFANKAHVYELFDAANIRAYSPGKPAQGEYGDVGMPVFVFTNADVEQLYYVYFAQSKGRLILRDVVTGDSVADLYLHDEEILAKSKLEQMFRALNDGDQSGLKALCTPGFYDAVQAWGGVTHPGDRLTTGHTLSQVSIQTSVQHDQKSIRVVSKISYPMSDGSNLTFFVDFERIDNELKIVRVRDSENKIVVFDPNIDNYLDRRYGLPDAPPINVADVAMTDQDPLLPLDQLRAKAHRVLEYQDLQQIAALSRFFIALYPTSPEGYGMRTAADLMQHKYEDADNDAHKALELKGTAYFVLDRYSTSSAKPFTPVVLGVSSSTIEYLPGPGFGNPQKIPMQTVTDANFAKGTGRFGFNLSQAGPFLKLKFKGPDGKKTVDYDFADFGTKCATPDAPNQPSGMIDIPSNGTCGTGSTNGQVSGAFNYPFRTAEAWHEDLAIVSELILSQRGGPQK